MKFSSGDVAAIVGVSPEPWGADGVSILELWERFKVGREDRFAAQKRVSRALESGVEVLLVGARGVGSQCVKVALWHLPAAWDTEGPPKWFFVAAQWRMLQDQAQTCRTACLLSGGVLRSGSMRADTVTQQALAEAVAAFEASLSSDRPPQPSAPADLEVVKRMFPRGDDTDMRLPDQATVAWERIKKLRRAANDAKKQRAMLEARIRGWMGSASTARVGSLRLALRSVRLPGGHSGRTLVEL